MVKSGDTGPMLLARGGGVFESRVSPLKSGLLGFQDALFFMAIALALHGEMLEIQTYHYFSSFKILFGILFGKSIKKIGKIRSEKSVAKSGYRCQIL
jgi:hypothetical protein